MTARFACLLPLRAQPTAGARICSARNVPSATHAALAPSLALQVPQLGCIATCHLAPSLRPLRTLPLLRPLLLSCCLCLHLCLFSLKDPHCFANHQQAELKQAELSCKWNSFETTPAGYMTALAAGDKETTRKQTGELWQGRAHASKTGRARAFSHWGQHYGPCSCCVRLRWQDKFQGHPLRALLVMRRLQPLYVAGLESLVCWAFQSGVMLAASLLLLLFHPGQLKVEALDAPQTLRAHKGKVDGSGGECGKATGTWKPRPGLACALLWARRREALQTNLPADCTAPRRRITQHHRPRGGWCRAGGVGSVRAAGGAACSVAPTPLHPHPPPPSPTRLLLVVPLLDAGQVHHRRGLLHGCAAAKPVGAGGVVQPALALDLAL